MAELTTLTEEGRNIMADQPATDRVVVVANPSGSHTFISRARLRVNGLPTPLGERLRELLGAAEGVDIDHIGNTKGGYGAGVSTVHPALWPWDDVEPAVLDAYRQLLGAEELDVIREGGTPAPDGLAYGETA